mgnify:FL=1
MLLNNQPIDTSSYLIMGLLILTIIGSSYCLYLYRRFNKLNILLSKTKQPNDESP